MVMKAVKRLGNTKLFISANLHMENVKSTYKEFTLYTDSGESGRQPPRNLIIGGARCRFYISHGTFQHYRLWSRKVSNKLDYSCPARDLNKTTSNNPETSQTFRRYVRRALLTAFLVKSEYIEIKK